MENNNSNNVVIFPKVPIRDITTLNDPKQPNNVYMDAHKKNKCLELTQEILSTIVYVLNDNNLQLNPKNDIDQAYLDFLGNSVSALISHFYEIDHPFHEFISETMQKSKVKTIPLTEFKDKSDEMSDKDFILLLMKKFIDSKIVNNDLPPDGGDLA